MDTYKEVKVIQFPNMTARVYIPDLSQEERFRRMKSIWICPKKKDSDG